MADPSQIDTEVLACPLHKPAPQGLARRAFMDTVVMYRQHVAASCDARPIAGATSVSHFPMFAKRAQFQHGRQSPIRIDDLLAHPLPCIADPLAVSRHEGTGAFATDMSGNDHLDAVP